jgi:hypothetical protein
MASGLFWGILSLLAFRYFWGIYYRYMYPRWLRRMAPLNIVLYGLLGLTMWLLARQFTTFRMAIFLILGGFEGVLEHLIGIYGLDVLKRVPWLAGLEAFPVLVFSFVEYMVIWSLVVWLAMGLGLIS